MEIQTLSDLFYFSVDRFAKPDHMRYKRGGAWHDISSAEFRIAVEELSMGLRAIGIERGDRVAILAENRPEWAFADLATLTAAGVVAPIYSTLSAPQVLYILNDAEAKAIFVSNAVQEAKVVEIRAQAPALRHVIRMDPDPVPGPGTLALDAVRALGRAALAADPGAVRKRAAEAKAGDLATLIYTSGTTGEPKGVMLSHSNLVSNVMASLKAFDGISETDVALSFLPLCHVFERMGGHYLMLRKGTTIAYAEGVDKVPENMLEVRPTLMLSVPRLYEKMYQRIHEKVAAKSPLRQKVFRWALGVGRRLFQHRVAKSEPGLLLKLQGAVADRFVFAEIKARTGGRLRLFVSGGAPLAREIAEFFGATGLLILEGYGLTETSPVICVNTPSRLKPGSVGPALEGVELKIASDGEILTRGPHVMLGYYKRPEATAEAIDKDGWFHTGDVGVVDADGFLVITDRKKDILVTSGGKNIAPQPIEQRLKTNRFFTEVVMVGNRRNFPAALVVPNFETLESWARQKGLSFGDRAELVGKAEVTQHYTDVIASLTADCAQFEKIKKIALLTREFSLDAGELTPTLKVKRRVIEQKYKDMIDRMYEGPAA